MTKTDNFKSHR